MDNQAEEADALNALADQANKAFTEISTKIENLTGQVASLEDQIKLGGQPTQGVQDALARVKDTIQKLDDIVPDAVTPPATPPPVETPPAEPPAPVETPVTP